MSEQLLFIGGDADGHRLPVGDNVEFYRIPKRIDFVGVSGEKYARAPEEVIRFDEYRLVRFTDGSNVMVITIMTPDQAISSLLASYHPGHAISGQWHRGVAPIMQGEQSPGVVVEMSNEAIYEMQSRGAQFSEATVIFHPISKE